MPPLRDLSGMRFGLLQPMWPAGHFSKYHKVMWLCQCSEGISPLYPLETFVTAKYFPVDVFTRTLPRTVILWEG